MKMSLGDRQSVKRLLLVVAALKSGLIDAPGGTFTVPAVAHCASCADLHPLPCRSSRIISRGDGEFISVELGEAEILQA